MMGNDGKTYTNGCASYGPLEFECHGMKEASGVLQTCIAASDWILYASSTSSRSWARDITRKNLFGCVCLQHS
jgi:hypothetical protein